MYPMVPRAGFSRPLRLSGARSLASRLSIRPSWVCPSCIHAPSPARRAMSSASDSSDPPKPFYVTTPIFYVNASPHVGHMYTMMLADSLKRWQTLRQRKAILLTGTDEHGMKVQRAAAQQGVSAKELCDNNSQKFRELAAACGIDNDIFVRTTDPDHLQAVQHFWFLLREGGHIYETTHSGWYCVSDECFYAEDEIERTVVPLTGRTIMASIVSGNEVEWIEEKNYHFRMTAFRDQLLKFYEENPNWILPKSRMNEVVHWVTNNLEDLSISRPVSRLDWGIRVPDDPSQTIYVWVDALINYITKAGFPNWAPGDPVKDKGGWPADVQIIGKDILRFHGVYWPALLMAVGIEPPKQLLSHAHWTLGKKKMSKSLGNVVNPFFAIERWGLDAMRYFMLHDGGIENDADYENSLILARYEKDLQSTIGNTLGRVTRSEKWKLTDAVARARTQPADSDFARKLRDSLVKSIQNAAPSMATAMEERLNPSAAIGVAIDLLVEANRYISFVEPWKQQATPHLRDEAIYHTAEALRVAAILLQPFMPDKMSDMLDILGVAEDKRTFEQAGFGADLEYGESKMRLLRPGKWTTLFPPPAAKD
ncbi:methionyl-tRNA synthetase [Plectosphaerella plurivora]|uniref:Probable methionine--tRNA ligase, mitochondrial n=1 Tax=Plectosphaerella plurivora TaxID=936078 RepID=A0A9P8VFK2_9PEZI|nr:methionyl-tRNA synthetase [Plectosphaerella plurivora]